MTKTRLTRSLPLAAVAAASLLIGGCVVPPYYHPGFYPPAAGGVVPGQVVQGSFMEFGQVVNIEMIQGQTVGQAPTGGGAVAGGLIGGVLGNQIGRGSGRAAATALGVIGGAVAGNVLEAQATGPRQFQSFRISVQLDQGGFRVFDVPHPGDLRIGDHVRIENGQISRF